MGLSIPLSFVEVLVQLFESGNLSLNFDIVMYNIVACFANA
jgi:hypothetical protein